MFVGAAGWSQTTAPAVDTAKQIATMQAKLDDWAQLERYERRMRRLPCLQVRRVVFYGDSITDAWARRHPSGFFPGKNYVGRGISGQTTPQMLVRFQQDVINLHPRLW